MNNNSAPSTDGWFNKLILGLSPQYDMQGNRETPMSEAPMDLNSAAGFAPSKSYGEYLNEGAPGIRGRRDISMGMQQAPIQQMAQPAGPESFSMNPLQALLGKAMNSFRGGGQAPQGQAPQVAPPQAQAPQQAPQGTAQEQVLAQFGGSMQKFNEWHGGLSGSSPKNWDEALSALYQEKNPAMAVAPQPQAYGAGSPLLMELAKMGFGEPQGAPQVGKRTR